MKTGVLYISDDNILGVNFSEEGRTHKVSDVFTDMKSLNNSRKTIVGLPLDKFIIKTVKLPKLNKDELIKAVELQEQFVLGESEYSNYSLTSTLIPYKNVNILFIIAAEIPEQLKKLKSSVVIPVQAGLYAYAVKNKLFDSKKSVMLVYIDKEYTHLLVINELQIVFMRTFTSRSDINSEIRLSEQAVYLQQERTFLKIDEYIFFTDKNGNKDKISISESATLKWIDIIKDQNSGCDITIPMGLSYYYSVVKNLSSWNIAKKPLSTTDSLKRSMFWIAPILLLFLPLYYYADYYKDQSSIAVILEEKEQFAGQVNRVDMLNIELRRIENIIKDYATPCLAYAKFNYMLDLINESRPKQLWLASISGKVNGDLVLTGFAGNFSQISHLINKLNESDFIDSINLNYSNVANSSKVNFQLTVKLNPTNKFIFDDVKRVSEEALDSKVQITKDNKFNDVNNLDNLTDMK